MKAWPAACLLAACASPVAAPAPDAVADAAVEVAAGADASIFCSLDCDDHNPCTDDVCYVKIGCTHIPHSGKCDDGKPCTTDDFCTGDTCAGVCALPGGCTNGCG